MNARTCVGCRGRADADELMRIVVDQNASAPVAVVDSRRRMPGRGAHLHPARDCIDKAIRRKALSRALKVSDTLGVQLIIDAIDHQLTTSQMHRKVRTGMDTQ